MTKEDKIIELSSMLSYTQMRLEEFYNKGFYSDNPTRKELFYIIKEAKRTLSKVREN